MGKALIIGGADFSSIAVGFRDVDYSNADLHTGAITGFSDSTTGRVRTDVTGYKHKIIDVGGFDEVVFSGFCAIHIGAFYSSTEIGESTFLPCGGQLTLTQQQQGNKTDMVVTIPTGAVVISFNMDDRYNNYSLKTQV